MEGQHAAGGEPQKVRTRKHKTHDPAVIVNRGSQRIAHGQQPSINTSNHAAQQPPEVANWEGHGNADPAQAYPDYGYGDHYVDAHGYDYGGAQAGAYQGGSYDHVDQGYHYGDLGQGYEHDTAGQGYDYGYANQRYGYAGTQVDPAQVYGHGGTHVNAAQGYGQDGAQGDDQGYGSIAPTQHTSKAKLKKSRNPEPVAESVHQREYQGSYENQHQSDGYDQQVRGSFKNQHQFDMYNQPVHDGYDNGIAPASGANSKRRTLNPQDQYEDYPVPPQETPYAENALPSKVINRVRGEHHGHHGSARSQTSQEGSESAPDRSKSADSEGSGSNRPKPHHHRKAENETRSSRSNAKAEKMGSEGKYAKTPGTNFNEALNEHMRKTAGSSKPAYNDTSMVVFLDPNESRTFDDAKLPPVVEKTDRPQYQPRRSNHSKQYQPVAEQPQYRPVAEQRQYQPVAEQPQYQRVAEQPQYRPVVEKPRYQPVQRRVPPGYVNTPLVPSNVPQVGFAAKGIEVYDAEGKQIQPDMDPNAKCMACVHNIGVPVAKFATRVVCWQCCLLCTIL